MSQPLPPSHDAKAEKHSKVAKDAKAEKTHSLSLSMMAKSEKEESSTWN